MKLSSNQVSPLYFPQHWGAHTPIFYRLSWCHQTAVNISVFLYTDINWSIRPWNTTKLSAISQDVSQRSSWQNLIASFVLSLSQRWWIIVEIRAKGASIISFLVGCAAQKSYCSFFFVTGGYTIWKQCMATCFSE